ncbi:MAG: molybdopterin-dependent oxidoreductase [Deltaproteobacteria bacterium]|nr:molybdopterin-dependent oxidoreductase [Deltaproteobacteria bacterium]
MPAARRTSSTPLRPISPSWKWIRKAGDSGAALHSGVRLRARHQPGDARGQIVGGVVQGLGYALMEDIPLDLESGAPLALNLQDFKFPTLVDLPSIEPVLIEQDDPFGPYGAKALGEPPLVPVAATIANAVCDATGVRIRDLPITAEKVLRGLNEGVKQGENEI